MRPYALAIAASALSLAGARTDPDAGAGATTLNSQFKYTARDMLSAPRPHAPILHPDGNSALHVMDQWDPETDSMGRTVSILQLPSGKAEQVLQASTREVGEVFWLSDSDSHEARKGQGPDDVEYERKHKHKHQGQHDGGGGGGGWAYLNGSAIMQMPQQRQGQGQDHSGETIYTFPKGVAANDFRYTDGKLFFVGQVWEGHALEETDKVDGRYEQRGDTGLVYDELFVRCVSLYFATTTQMRTRRQVWWVSKLMGTRHWDIWRTPGKGWTVG